MLVNHERRLLNKAAVSGDNRISVQRNPDQSWPGDHSRLTALESVGHLERIGCRDVTDDMTGDTPGDGLATWRITSTGLSQLQNLVGGDA